MRNITSKANFTAPLLSASAEINRHYDLKASTAGATASVLLAQLEIIFEVLCDDPIAFVEDNPQVLKQLYLMELQKKDAA